MINKRGQSLSMNTIIITILVVLVLVVVAVFFAGGMSSLISKIKGVTSSSGLEVSEARLKCTSWCQKYETTTIDTYADQFCNSAMNVDLNENDKLEDDETNIDCRDKLKVRCDVITESICEEMQK